CEPGVPYADPLGPEYLDEECDVVGAAVHQDAAAGDARFKEPAALRLVLDPGPQPLPSRDLGHPVRIAELAGVDEPDCLRRGGHAREPRAAAADEDATRLRRGDDSAGIRDRRGEWFLDEDVAAGFRGCHGE